MSEEFTRRDLLALGSAIGVHGLAGCSQAGEENETVTSTTTSATSIDTQTATDTTTATPEVGFDLEISTIETGSEPSLVVKGTITSSTNLDTITIEVKGESQTFDPSNTTAYFLDAEFPVEGGQSYGVVVTATDMNGETYRRTFESEHVDSPTEKIETDHLVGAHYYPWYEMHGGHQNWTERTMSEPILGEYAADDPEVIRQHLDWCLAHGIEWLSMSWWGPGSGSDSALSESILSIDRFQDIEFSILYETVGRFEEYDYNLDNSDARDRLEADLSYLDGEYFDEDNYFTQDSRPVLFLYVSNLFHGDIEGAFERATQGLDREPYILADVPFGSAPNSYPIMTVADGVTSYNPYMARPDIEEVFHDLFEQGCKTMNLGAEASGVALFPVVIPGFNDSKIRDNPTLPASPTRFERVCNQVQPHLADSNAILVTSFNEWYENTQIEPSEEYDEEYLRVTRDELATAESRGFHPSGAQLRLSFNKTIVPAEVNPESTDRRELAFMAGGLTFLGEGEEVKSFNIGNEANEPLLLKGVYGATSDGDRSWRWLGGREAETVFFIEGDVGEMDTAVLTGQPMRSNEIEATVHFDGVETDHVAFEERDGVFDTYELSLLRE